MSGFGDKLRQLARACATLSLLFALAGAAPPASPIASEELTLEKSIDIAIHNATSVLVGSNQYDLTATQVLQAYAQFLPNLSVNADYGYQTGINYYTFHGATIVDSRGRTGGYSLSSVLNLFNGMADYSGLKSALARREATGLSLEWARQQIALDISQTYLQLVLDQQILMIARKNLQASRLRLTLLEGQTQVGQTAIPDLYRQQAQTSADSFATTSYEVRVKDDQVLLLRKLRVDPTKSFRFETPALEPVRSPLASKPVNQLIDETLSTRADVRSNVSALEASDWQVTGARSGFLPRLDLVFARNSAGSYLWRNNVDGANFLPPNQTSMLAQLRDQVDYTVTLNLTWNLFDRFVTRLNVATAKANQDNTRIGLEDSRLQVSADIRTAYNNYAAAFDQVETAKIGVRSAQKSYDAVQGMYEVGSASIVDVLTAQAALVQAQSNLAQALTNLKLQDKTLAYSTGRVLAPAP